MSASVQILTILLLSFLLLVEYPTITSGGSCNNPHSIHTSNKRRQRMDRFLRDILKSRDELIWIDRMGDLLRKTDLTYASSALKNKANAMFIDVNHQLYEGLHDDEIDMHRRRKRSPIQIAKIAQPVSSAVKTCKNVAINENTKILNKSFDKNLYLDDESNFRDTSKDDSLDQLIDSINVFPTEKLDTATSHNNNNRPIRSLKSVKPIDDLQLNAGLSDNSFMKMLSSDSANDNSQMFRALHGDLAEDIVNAILTEMNSGKDFDSSRNPRVNNIKSLTGMDVNQRRSILEENENTRKLMNFIEQLLTDEIEKRSCGSLSPDLHEFYHWLLETEQTHTEKIDKVFNTREASLIEDNEKNINDPFSNLDEWYRKSETLRRLLREYNELSRKDRYKVQAIGDYLANRLEFVDAYIDAYRRYSNQPASGYVKEKKNKKKEVRGI